MIMSSFNFLRDPRETELGYQNIVAPVSLKSTLQVIAATIRDQGSQDSIRPPQLQAHGCCPGPLYAILSLNRDPWTFTARKYIACWLRGAGVLSDHTAACGTDALQEMSPDLAHAWSILSTDCDSDGGAPCGERTRESRAARQKQAQQRYRCGW